MKRSLFFILLAGVTLLLSACGESQETAAGCGVDLDNSNFDAVIAGDCTNYEKASAYLGKAEISMSNLLEDGATDNLNTALNIQSLDNATDYTAGNRQYITNALCLVGSDNITSSSRCTTNSVKRTGSRSCANGDCEVAMFANLVDLLYTVYGTLDQSPRDGTIDNSEVDTFTGSGSLNNVTIPVLSIDNSTLEVVINGTRYVQNTGNGTCEAFGLDYGDYIANPSSITGACPVAQPSSVIAFLKVDNVTDLTQYLNASASTGLATSIVTATESLNSDFAEMGVAADSSFRTDLLESTEPLDNGLKKKNGTDCGATAEFDKVFFVTKNSADNATTLADITGGKQRNLVPLLEIQTNVDSSISAPSTSGGPTIVSLRKVFKSAAGYTYSYEAALSDIATGVSNMNDLDQEDSVAGDGLVSFRELLCVSEYE